MVPAGNQSCFYFTHTYKLYIYIFIYLFSVLISLPVLIAARHTSNLGQEKVNKSGDLFGDHGKFSHKILMRLHNYLCTVPGLGSGRNLL